jgi:hypothetical protein
MARLFRSRGDCPAFVIRVSAFNRLSHNEPPHSSKRCRWLRHRAIPSLSHFQSPSVNSSSHFVSLSGSPFLMSDLGWRASPTAVNHSRSAVSHAPWLVRCSPICQAQQVLDEPSQSERAFRRGHTRSERNRVVVDDGPDRRAIELLCKPTTCTWLVRQCELPISGSRANGQ